MPLHFRDGRAFATGCARYRSRTPTERDTAPKPHVKVQIDDLREEALLDTGAAYLICPPRVANLLTVSDADVLEEVTIVIRGSPVVGKLHRFSLTLIAEEGEGLTIDVTAFIPDERREERWASDLPCFLGWQGCLDRLRFALDPLTEKFYFGPVG